ncbi:MAG: hypothetical protein KKA28_00680 [Planctomycetes bacterium]|nr:hypothetical protein [Planctomycetota bacterium]MCG2684173.1 hypothetical protein [Planctomycetales bacterium]
MQLERYFIIGDFYSFTNDKGQPWENEILALIDDLTPEEAELVAKARMSL